MKTNIKNSGSYTIVEVSGFLDFEKTRPFAESIESIYQNNKDAQVVIDLTELEFVGSSGISNFVKDLRVFNRLKMKPSYCGVKSEYKKLFRLFEENQSFEVCNDRNEALRYAELRSKQK